MRGIPGSGKSTIAMAIAQATGAVIVSSDGTRAQLYGSEEIQGNGNEVFYHVRSKIADALYNGFDVIVDTTGINLTSVRQYEFIADYFGATLQIVEVRPSLEICKKRNAARTRKVPEHVIEGMYATISKPQKPDFTPFAFEYANLIITVP
jgi:predicted kinase